MDIPTVDTLTISNVDIGIKSNISINYQLRNPIRSTTFPMEVDITIPLSFERAKGDWTACPQFDISPLTKGNLAIEANICMLST